MDYSAYIYYKDLAIGAVSYHDDNVKDYEYVIEPFYHNVALAESQGFRGIQGIDLSLLLPRYVRKNIQPVFIFEHNNLRGKKNFKALQRVGNISLLEYMAKSEFAYFGDKLTVRVPRITPLLPDSKVLLQLSGGKDSVACMILLKRCGVSVEAIHFTHHYNYSLPTDMARMACEALNVPLHVVDITPELESLLLDGFRGRPCRYCKGIMDQLTVNHALQHGCHYICVGDTQDDKTLTDRLRQSEGEARQVSRYFNRSVTLPEEMSIYRPLLHYTSDMTLHLVKSVFPDFKRVNDTGDKYFEYSREGCALQFKDLGVPYTKRLMTQLKQLNSMCADYATQRGIRASIHLPSEFIVTIPRGHEDACAAYIEKRGVHLNKPAEAAPFPCFGGALHATLHKYMRDSAVVAEATQRMAERLGIDSSAITATTLCEGCLLLTVYRTDEAFKENTLAELCIEIFHTTAYKIATFTL